MKHTLILGLPRTGKTTLAKNIFTNLNDNHYAVFINTQWENYFQNCQIIYSLDKVDKKYKQFVYNIIKCENLYLLLDKVLNNAKHSKRLYPISIFIDEAHRYFNRYMNIHNINYRAVKEIFTMGLKWNIRLILISQKPQLLCSDLYTLCERLIIFKLHKNDVVYLKMKGFNIKEEKKQYEYEIIE